MDKEAESLAKNTHNFTKDQLRVTQPGMLHSHMNLCKEQIKNPWAVIPQTLLSHKQLGLQQSQTQQRKQPPAQYFVMSSLISAPRGAENNRKKRHLKNCFNFICSLGHK